MPVNSRYLRGPYSTTSSLYRAAKSAQNKLLSIQDAEIKYAWDTGKISNDSYLQYAQKRYSDPGDEMDKISWSKTIDSVHREIRSDFRLNKMLELSSWDNSPDKTLAKANMYANLANQAKEDGDIDSFMSLTASANNTYSSYKTQIESENKKAAAAMEKAWKHDYVEKLIVLKDELLRIRNDKSIQDPSLRAAAAGQINFSIGELQQKKAQEMMQFGYGDELDALNAWDAGVRAKNSFYSENNPVQYEYEKDKNGITITDELGRPIPKLKDRGDGILEPVYGTRITRDGTVTSNKKPGWTLGYDGDQVKNIKITNVNGKLTKTIMESVTTEDGLVVQMPKQIVVQNEDYKLDNTGHWTHTYNLKNEDSEDIKDQFGNVVQEGTRIVKVTDSKGYPVYDEKGNPITKQINLVSQQYNKLPGANNLTSEQKKAFGETMLGSEWKDVVSLKDEEMNGITERAKESLISGGVNPSTIPDKLFRVDVSDPNNIRIVLDGGVSGKVAEFLNKQISTGEIQPGLYTKDYAIKLVGQNAEGLSNKQVENASLGVTGKFVKDKQQQMKTIGDFAKNPVGSIKNAYSSANKLLTNVGKDIANKENKGLAMDVSRGYLGVAETLKRYNPINIVKNITSSINPFKPIKIQPSGYAQGWASVRPTGGQMIASKNNVGYFRVAKPGGWDFYKGKDFKISVEDIIKEAGGNKNNYLNKSWHI